MISNMSDIQPWVYGIRTKIPNIYPNIRQNNGYLDKYPVENQLFDLTHCVDRIYFDIRPDT